MCLNSIYCGGTFYGILVKPHSHIWLSGFLICLRFIFFSFVCEQTRTPTRPIVMMSSSANERPFLSSFRHIPPQESLVQLANLTIQTKNGRRGERLISSNLGLNPSWMDARTFARIKNLIWDRLLATKAEIM